jgi:hypothetical protein
VGNKLREEFIMSDFYEKECLPRVRRIAENLEWLCNNSVDKDELESQIEDMETEWQDKLYDYISENDIDDINPYDLTAEELINTMSVRGIEVDEDDIEEYNELREQLREIESAGASNLNEYFEDCLDIEYTIDSRGNYLGVCVWICVGGPGIWIDTRDRAVKLAWGSDRAEAYITSDVVDAIDDIFEEYYNCLK